MASELQDGWVEGPHGRLRSWYARNCGSVVSSKAWKRRYQARDAVRQRYYYLACGKKHRARVGQVIEIYYPTDNITCWARAEPPPDALEDIRGMATEAGGVPNTPQAFFAALAQYTPTTGTIFRRMGVHELRGPADPGAAAAVEQIAMLLPEGKALLESRPMFPWNQLLTLF